MLLLGQKKNKKKKDTENLRVGSEWHVVELLVPVAILAAAHTVGFGHCSTFADRIQPQKEDPTMNATYAVDLQAACPTGVDPNIALQLDPVTPQAFDNQYFVNLVNGRGLLTSDQVLYSDARSQPTVVAWAQNATDFELAFVDAITRLGRVGVKTDPSQGNIRRDCAFLN
jgi:peroxidase